jgi:hypothetical protein
LKGKKTSVLIKAHLACIVYVCLQESLVPWAVNKNVDITCLVVIPIAPPVIAHTYTPTTSWTISPLAPAPIATQAKQSIQQINNVPSLGVHCWQANQ